MIPPKIHNILSFNGSNNFVQLDRASSLKLNNRSFTVQAWVRPKDLTNSDRTILGTDTAGTNLGLHFVIRNKKVYMGFYGNDLTGVKTLQNNKWYHITWRYNKNSGEQAIFINGTLDASGTGHAAFAGTAAVRIGRWISRNYFKGEIAEVMIWEKVLSDDYIKASFKQQTRGAIHGLTAHWSMDDGEGSTSIKNSVNVNQAGTLQNDCSWINESNLPFRLAPVKNNNLLQFNGNTYVNLPKANELGITDSSFTVEAWFKANNLPNVDQVIFGTDTMGVNIGLHLVIRNKKPYMGFYGNDTAGTTTIQTNQWYHISWRYDIDKGEQAIFLNGNEEIKTKGHAAFKGKSVLKIGRWAGARYFTGVICEAVYWNRALSADRIKANMQNRPVGNEKDLIAYFPMNEGSGTKIKEFSANGMTGNIINGAWIAHEEVPFRPLLHNSGEKTRLLAKIRTIGNEDIAKAKADGHKALSEARKNASDKIAQAHHEATTQMNNTKFEHIYFISGNRLKKVNPAGQLDMVYARDIVKRDVVVEGSYHWEYSQVTIDPTQKARIRYKSGSWTSESALGTTDANGFTGTQAGARAPMPDQPKAALVGNVGETTFLIGNDGEVPDGLSGELSLAMNVGVRYSIRPPVRPWRPPVAVMRRSRSIYGIPFSPITIYRPPSGPGGDITVEVELTPKNPGEPPIVIASDIVVEGVAKKIYIARHIAPFQLNCINFDGKEFTTIYSGEAPITSLTMDLVSKKIYFIEGNGVIKSIDANGENMAQLLDISAPHKDGYWRIDLDKTNSKLYWTNENSIWRVSTDGSNPELVIGNADGPFPVDIAVDGAGKKCYWVDNDLKYVMRGDLDHKQVLAFNGTNNYVELSKDPFENNEQFTISCWVKPSTINDGHYHGFIGKQANGDRYRKPGMWLTPRNSGLHYDSYSPDGTRFGELIDNFFDDRDVWVHVTWVKEGTEYRFYKNGRLFTKKSAPEKFYTRKSTYWIGRVDNLWKGQMAEVQIWNRPITTAEIKKYMHAPVHGKPEGLTNYLSFRNPSGTTTENHVNKTNNGRIIGAQCVRSRDIIFKNAEMLYPCPNPHAGLALDIEDGTLKQIYWTATENDGTHYMMRGSMDGSEPPEKLFEVPCQGGIALLTKGMVEHERRSLAYKQRKEAKEKAAKDLNVAHQAAHERVQQAHNDYAVKQKQAHTDITNAQAAAVVKKRNAKKDLKIKQDSAHLQISNAHNAAAQKRHNANQQASDIKNRANTEANRMKNNAQSKLNSARRERSKY